MFVHIWPPDLDLAFPTIVKTDPRVKHFRLAASELELSIAHVDKLRLRLGKEFEVNIAVINTNLRICSCGGIRTWP